MKKIKEQAKKIIELKTNIKENFSFRFHFPCCEWTLTDNQYLHTYTWVRLTDDVSRLHRLMLIYYLNNINQQMNVKSSASSAQRR